LFAGLGITDINMAGILIT